MKFNQPFRAIKYLILMVLPLLLLLCCGRNPEDKTGTENLDFSPSTSAHVRTDINLAQALLAFSGGSRVKLVWLQGRLIDEDTIGYVPNYRDFLFNAPSSQIIVFDTDEGSGRILDTVPKARSAPLISRDGTKVLWSDLRNNTLNVINWDGTGKKTILRDAAFYLVCVQIDNQTNTEWVYVSSLWLYPITSIAQCYDIYRYKFINGTELDTAHRELVSRESFYPPWTVSSDGKFGGGLLTWPNTGVQSLPLGQVYSVCSSGVNCCAELAPDTSYLFFLFHNTHYGLTMYKFSPAAAAYLGTVGCNVDGAGMWDCCCPRWTNRVQFLTGGYPYCAGWFFSTVGTPLPSDPKKIALGATGEFCFGKFDSTYSHIEWVRITDNDIRFRKVVGDGWVEN